MVTGGRVHDSQVVEEILDTSLGPEFCGRMIG
jgi:hypothetical protein